LKQACLVVARQADWKLVQEDVPKRVTLAFQNGHVAASGAVWRGCAKRSSSSQPLNRPAPAQPSATTIDTATAPRTRQSTIDTRQISAPIRPPDLTDIHHICTCSPLDCLRCGVRHWVESATVVPTNEETSQLSQRHNLRPANLAVDHPIDNDTFTLCKILYSHIHLTMSLRPR
jgi:hypothetical protein